MRTRSHSSRQRAGIRLPGAVVLSAGLLGACATPYSQQELLDSLGAVQARLTQVEAELVTARQTLAQQQIDGAGEESLDERFESLQARLDELPAQVSGLCQTLTVAAGQCDSSSELRRVPVSGDKLVVGELERVWIEPPGATLNARVDTGAESSSMHATELVNFERDGDRWVRFNLLVDEGTITLERRVIRYVRVYQQADPEGTRRPVVALRVAVGDVRENVEFTLADRSHLNFEMLLGRNFLTDVALVDVGKQYVQPPHRTTDR